MGEADRKPKFLTVCGLPAVAALFAMEPDRVRRLAYTEALQHEAGPFCKLLAARRVPYRLVAEAELAKIAATPLHGGIVAAIPQPALYDATTEQLRSWAAEGKPLLLLDGVGNPHNLGAIVRSAAFFGLPRLLLSDDSRQATVSSAAWRVAEGGFSQLKPFRLRKVPQALREVSEQWRLVATVATGGRPPTQIARDRPPLLVLGNEERGLPPATLAACDERLTLRGSGRLQSLNVAQTAAILLYAFA